MRVPSFYRSPGSHQVDRTIQALAINYDLDRVAVPHLADRPAGQRLRSHVADAGAGGDAG